MEKNWFVGDREGIRRIAKRRGYGRVVLELIQNAWDTGAKEVEVTLTPVPGRPAVDIFVRDDDPHGFQRLSDAWTLFGESTKGADAVKRGKFCLGEKFVIACCETATIKSTTGGVRFDDEGRHTLRSTTEAGSTFAGTIPMTREELDELLATLSTLIPQQGIKTTINGQELAKRRLPNRAAVDLPTEATDDEGILRRRIRRTEIWIHEPVNGERPTLYEMGIPVVELEGDRYHYDIQQRVPVSLERDNVSEAYLRAVRVAVLNTMRNEITTPEQANEPWVRDAMGDKRTSSCAIQQVVTAAYGERAVAFDPRDPEANQAAAAAGYTVVPGGAFSGKIWAEVKRAREHTGVLPPASQVTPTAKAFGEDGRELRTVKREDWTPGMAFFARYAVALAQQLLGHDVRVIYANEPTWPFAAVYGSTGTSGEADDPLALLASLLGSGSGNDLYLNVGRLGRAVFTEALDSAIPERLISLLIHEFGHDKASNHLSEQYYSALCTLGAKMRKLGGLEDVVRGEG